MKAQQVKIKFPHMRIELGEDVLEVEGWEGQVKDLADLKYRVNEGFHDVLRILLRKLQGGPFEATLTMEQFDKELAVPFIVDGSPWTITPAISEQSLKVLAGESVAIRFMGLLHRTLYDASNGSHRVKGRAKTLATLRSLELIEEYWQVTDKGQKVLSQLHELGPPSGRRGFIMMATEMLNVAALYRDRNPLRMYLYDKRLIMSDGKSYVHQGNYKLTHAGREWLETNSAYMLQLEQFADQLTLIQFLPIESLNQFLTSEEYIARRAARERMEELKEREMII